MTQPRAIYGNTVYHYKYSVCTLVNNQTEYAEMVSSFQQAGFIEDTEYLFIDNSSDNVMDAYSGLNQLLQHASGEYIILCHQDVLLHDDKKQQLDACIEQLNSKDPAWALCGNAGAAGPNHIVYRISYPNGLVQSKGKFPVRVDSLDENFIIVKRDARISLSYDLDGFHLYGADICLLAKIRGYSSYVINFNLLHKSRGNPDESFKKCRKKLIQKYNKAFRPRWVQTTTACFYLSGTLLGRLAGNGIFLFFVRMKNGLMKRIG